LDLWGETPWGTLGSFLLGALCVAPLKGARLYRGGFLNKLGFLRRPSSFYPGGKGHRCPFVHGFGASGGSPKTRPLHKFSRGGNLLRGALFRTQSPDNGWHTPLFFSKIWGAHVGFFTHSENKFLLVNHPPKWPCS